MADTPDERSSTRSTRSRLASGPSSPARSSVAERRTSDLRSSRAGPSRAASSASSRGRSSRLATVAGGLSCWSREASSALLPRTGSVSTRNWRVGGGGARHLPLQEAHDVVAVGGRPGEDQRARAGVGEGLVVLAEREARDLDAVLPEPRQPVRRLGHGRVPRARRGHELLVEEAGGVAGGREAHRRGHGPEGARAAGVRRSLGRRDGDRRGVGRGARVRAGPGGRGRAPALRRAQGAAGLLRAPGRVHVARDHRAAPDRPPLGVHQRLDLRRSPPWRRSRCRRGAHPPGRPAGPPPRWARVERLEGGRAAGRPRGRPTSRGRS